MIDIGIIGAGAAGLAAAVSACQEARRAGNDALRIAIFEASKKVGQPILRSGNGRCNFSNAHITPEAYNNPAGVACVLGADAQNPVAAFFADLGLVATEEAEGRLYPAANKASAVLDVLCGPLADAGVSIHTETPVQAINLPTDGAPFQLLLANGERVSARRVIVAAGGRAGAFGLSDTLRYQAPKPTLGPLATDPTHTKPLDNVRVRCGVTLVRNHETVAYERGEVLFRTYGVSGIAVFNLSRFAREGDVLVLDFFPDNPATADMVRRLPVLTEALFHTPTNEELLRGAVLPQVARQILHSLSLAPDTPATEESAAALNERLHNFPLEVRGMGPEDVCQVKRGGFALDAFHPDTLQARAVPGLYVVGEALDVDGACGGFNLHWAFLTGIKAGAHAAAGK